MKTEDTEVFGRELNYARSKPDTVNRPVRTARIFVYHCNSTQYCKTETVFSIFPFLQTNITSQIWPSGGKGGGGGGEERESRGERGREERARQ